MHRAGPSLTTRTFHRTARRAMGTVLLVVFGNQATVGVATRCTDADRVGTAGTPASTMAHGGTMSRDSDAPTQAPVHPSDCDHSAPAGPCTSCAVLAIGVSTISVATVFVVVPVVAADQRVPATYDREPDAPPPRA